MRIVGGASRGRRLIAPKGRELRPTSDRTREAVFNILEHGIPAVELEGASVVDVFAGTGALGIEALSRGAGHATFIDNDSEALGLVRKNVAAAGAWRNTTMLRLDASRLPPPPMAALAPCALAFLDAPYQSGLTQPALKGLDEYGWLAPGAVCVVEISVKDQITCPAEFKLLEERSYGAARVLFLARQP